MRILLFTHKNDIDGMGNVVLFKLAFNNVDYILCETFELNYKVSEFIITNKIYENAIQGYLKNIYYREILGMKAGIIFINYEFRNEIAEYLRENKYDIDFVMMISIDRGVISYRSTNKNISVRKVAEFYNGKGHDAAATNPIIPEQKEMILNILTKK